MNAPDLAELRKDTLDRLATIARILEGDPPDRKLLTYHDAEGPMHHLTVGDMLAIAAALSPERMEKVRKQLPEGMEDCTILFKECEKGHGRLTARNWVDGGCPWCRIKALEAERDELRATLEGTIAFSEVLVRREADLEDTLRKLVMLKDMNDAIAAGDVTHAAEYLRRKPLAWQRARQVLENRKGEGNV